MKRKLLSPASGINIVLTILFCGCVDPYSPPVIQTNYNILVADAYLNSKDGTATVKLSRTLPIYSADATPVESNAQVKIIDENGVEFLLGETSKGSYAKNNIPVNPNFKYRLSIQTSLNERYLSDAVPVVASAKIDSLFWLPDDDRITFYVNTKNNEGGSRFYRWDSFESYEYNSAYSSSVKLVSHVVYSRTPAEYINKCWRVVPYPDLILGSTISSVENVISHAKVKAIEGGSIKLSQTYSLLVRQYSLTEEAYNYWTKLKQTTENVGGLFDPMPTQVSGNIYNINSSDQVAIGFFSAGSFEEKRIFVNFYDLPTGLRHYATNCQYDSLPINEVLQSSDATLLIAPYGGFPPAGYLRSTTACIDCRALGGTTTKPSFWK
jgi:hypothetical protein